METEKVCVIAGAAPIIEKDFLQYYDNLVKEKKEFFLKRWGKKIKEVFAEIKEKLKSHGLITVLLLVRKKRNLFTYTCFTTQVFITTL